MTKKETVLNEILDLSPIDRVDIIEKIFTSLEKSSNKKIQAVWSEEAEKRVHGYLQGKIKSKPMNEVFNKINNET